MVPSISSAENSFSSVETTIDLLEQIYFLQKELCISYVVFLYKSSPTENP